MLSPIEENTGIFLQLLHQLVQRDVLSSININYKPIHCSDDDESLHWEATLTMNITSTDDPLVRQYFGTPQVNKRLAKQEVVLRASHAIPMLVKLSDKPLTYKGKHVVLYKDGDFEFC